jgi:hypothetical protein
MSPSLAVLGISEIVLSVLQFSEFPALEAKAMFFRDPEQNVLELICQDVTLERA